MSKLTKMVVTATMAAAFFLFGIVSVHAYSMWSMKEATATFNITSTMFDSGKYLVNKFDDGANSCYIVYSVYQGIPQNTSISCIKK